MMEIKKLPFAKKKKLRKIGALKREAWKVFSVWVRQRGMDVYGRQVCFTCDKADNWKNFHASHFYHGRNWMSSFDPRNVWPCCTKCNTYLHGNLIEYSERLRKIYGDEIVNILRELRYTPWKPSRQELEAIIEKYRYSSS